MRIGSASPSNPRTRSVGRATSPSGRTYGLDFHVMRHLCDMEALVTYEGTVEVQTLIVGRHTTGFGAFV
jgi:alkylation response protein AidB-like acyl-CoA dehydrogenase